MHSTKRKTIPLPPTPSSALSHLAHFQTISNDISILVQVCRPHKHLTIPTNGSSVTANVVFYFRNKC